MLKKILSALLAAVMLLALAVPALADTVNSGSNTGIDIVMVIDRSGTMRRTDPNGIALSATRALADISRESTVDGGVSIALVTYGYTVKNTTPFYNVSNPMEFQAFSDAVNNSSITSGDDTNTGLAMATAYRLIDKHRQENPQHQFAVILLSDGEVDLGDSEGYKQEHPGVTRGSAEWQELINTSIRMGDEYSEKLRNEGVPLYCIGIYDGNNMDSLGTDMMRWAGVENGVDTADDHYMITNDVNHVQDLMDNLYQQINGNADFQKASLKPGGYVDFDVLPGAIQVNIRVTPKIDDAIQDSAVKITMVDAMGNETAYDRRSIEGFAGMAANGTSDGSYTIIRMNQPVEGRYRLRIDDGISRDYELAIISLYDLKLTLDDIIAVPNGGSTTIGLEVTKDGLPYYDPGITPTLYAKGPFASASERDSVDYNPLGLPMTWDDREEKYFVDFTPNGKGYYLFQARMTTTAAENKSNERMMQVGSAEVTVNAGAHLEYSFTGHAIQAYTASGPVEPYSPWVLTLDDINNGNYLNNVDGVAIDQMDISFENNNDDLRWTKEGNEITIWAQSAGGAHPGTKDVNFTLSVVAAGNSTPLTIPGTITIEDRQEDVAQNPAAQVPAIELSGLLFGDKTIEQEVIANVNDLFIEPNENDNEHFDVNVLSVEEGDAGNRKPTDAIEAILDGSTGALKIVGKTAVNGAVVTLRATSTDGSAVDFEIPVSVENLLTRYLIIAGAAVAVLVLIVVILVVVHNANKPAFRRGSTLTIELTTENGTSVGVVSLSRYGKKAVKLSALCTASHVSTGKLRTTLEKVLILPRKKGGLVIRRGKKESILQNLDVHTIEFDSDRTIELSYNED